MKHVGGVNGHICQTLLCKMYNDYDSWFVYIFKLVIVFMKRVPIKWNNLLS